jgi:hypothetical protein
MYILELGLHINNKDNEALRMTTFMEQAAVQPKGGSTTGPPPTPRCCEVTTSAIRSPAASKTDQQNALSCSMVGMAERLGHGHAHYARLKCL